MSTSIKGMLLGLGLNDFRGTEGGRKTHPKGHCPPDPALTLYQLLALLICISSITQQEPQLADQS